MTERLIRFLLVEDSDSHAKLVARVLQKHRVRNELRRVADGQAALDYLAGKGEYADRDIPDVILLDLKLPKVDGHEVLKSIKAHSEWRHIPVVIMSTSDAREDRMNAYKSYANSYLIKPISFEGFQRMVNDLGLYWGVWNRRITSD